jgi:hypothetical protein
MDREKCELIAEECRATVEEVRTLLDECQKLLRRAQSAAERSLLPNAPNLARNTFNHTRRIQKQLVSISTHVAHVGEAAGVEMIWEQLDSEGEKPKVA